MLSGSGGADPEFATWRVYCPESLELIDLATVAKGTSPESVPRAYNATSQRNKFRGTVHVGPLDRTGNAGSSCANGPNRKGQVPSGTKPFWTLER